MFMYFALVGMPGAGKTYAGNFLEREHGFTQFNGGDYLQELAAKNDQRLNTRKDYLEFYLKQRELLGPTFITEHSQALCQLHENVVDVGLRTPSDIDLVIATGGVLIGIQATFAHRFKRTAGSSYKYPASISGFKINDELETNPPYDINYGLEKAPHTIYNNNHISCLETQLSKIVMKHSAGK